MIVDKSGAYRYGKSKFYASRGNPRDDVRRTATAGRLFELDNGFSAGHPDPVHRIAIPVSRT